MLRSSSPATVWAGRVLSALVVLFLVIDGGIDLLAPNSVAPQMAETGFPIAMAMPLGWIVLACTVLYAVPQTAIVGAILVTGFLGGAIATHFRLGEIGSPPQLIAIAVGILTWAGLALRDNRLLSLILPFSQEQRPSVGYAASTVR